MLRALLRTAAGLVVGAACGALAVAAGIFVWLEAIRPFVRPVQGGFDGEALVLYICGPPIGAALGAVAAVVRVVWASFRPTVDSLTPPGVRERSRDARRPAAAVDFGSLPRYPR